MKTFDDIRHYTPAALWKRAKKHIPRRVKAAPASRNAATPPIPSGRSLWLTVLDVFLVLAVLAGAFCFISLVASPDPRVTVRLSADGTTSEHFVFPTDVRSFLTECGIELEPEDTLSCALTDTITDGMEISVTRAFPVVVKSQSGIELLRMTGGTVGDALRAVDVEYDVNDELSHLSFEDLAPGMQIIHTDVVTEYDTAYRTLEYKKEVIKDDTVYNDTKPVLLQEGKDGTKQVTYRLVYKNGVRVSREVVDQVVITPATPEIKKVGTKIHYQTSLTGEFRIYKTPPVAGKDGSVEMKMDYITAYTGDTRTSTGVRPKLGTIAVNTYYIPYGTEIYVKGYGYGKAQDTGAFRNYKRADGTPVNQLDLFMNTEKECRRWGRKRNVTVLVKLG